MEAKMKIRTTGCVRDSPYLKQVSLQIRLWPTHPHETHVLIHTLLSVAHNLISNSEVKSADRFWGNFFCKNSIWLQWIHALIKQLQSSNGFSITPLFNGSTFIKHSSNIHWVSIKNWRCKVFVCSWKLAFPPFEQTCSFWIVLNIWELLEQNEDERWVFLNKNNSQNSC